MDLKNVSTKELVDELATREAVQKIVIGPYEDYSMTIDNKEIKRRRTGCNIKNLGLNLKGVLLWKI